METLRLQSVEAAGLAVRLFLLVTVVASVACGAPEQGDGRMVTPSQGDAALHGGSPTIRRPYNQRQDDPSTTNDESNDQPVGYFGMKTLSVCSLQAGNCYTLDADLSGTSMERIYFPKGGHVDFPDCELDDDLEGDCEDEQGRSWQVNGEP